MAERGQFLAQRLEVVGLAVVRDPVAPAMIGHGHVARGRQVDDAQAVGSETNVAVRPDTPIVRTSVNLEIAHPADDLRVFLFLAPAAQADEAGNPAHQRF